MKNLLALIICFLLFAITGIAMATNDPNLVSYWQFDEGCGNIAGDSSGNENDGILSANCSLYLSQAGKRNGACDFPEVSSEEAISIPIGKMCPQRGTVAVWINPVYPMSGVYPRDGYRFLFDFRGEEKNDRIQLYFKSSSWLNLGLGDNLFRKTNIANIPTGTDTWTHVAVTWTNPALTNGNYVVYVDGVQKAAGTYTGLNAIYKGVIGNSIGREMCCGEYAERDQGFNGKMDEFAVWNRVLQPSEIIGVMNNGVSITSVKANCPGPGRFAFVHYVNELRWTAGVGATSHNVYLSTTNPPLFVSNQTASVYPVSNLEMGATYYWRVDEVTSSGIITGDVWMFATNNGKTKSPGPIDGVTVTEIPLQLEWTPSLYADVNDSSNVYFGTTDPPQFAGKATFDIYDLTKSNLQPGTTYYWRIDQVTAARGVITGDIWSFKTQVPCDQLIGDLNADCLVDHKDLEIMAEEWLNSDGYTSGRTPIPYGAISFVPGKHGQALFFNGKDTYLEIEPEWILTHNVSFCFWVKSSGDQNCTYRTSMFSVAPMDSSGYLEFSDRRDNTLEIRDVNIVDFRTNASLSPGQWRHVGCIFRDVDADNCNVEVYLDGNLLVKTNSPVPIYNGEWEIPMIGARQYRGITGFFYGTIDEFRVYDYALTADVLAKIMDNSADAPNDAAIYYKFDGDLADSGKFKGPVYRPNRYISNIVVSEPNQLPDTVDFKDYSTMFK